MPLGIYLNLNFGNHVETWWHFCGKKGIHLKKYEPTPFPSVCCSKLVTKLDKSAEVGCAPKYCNIKPTLNKVQALICHRLRWWFST